MNSRNHLQNPFTRPLSQSSARDPRQAPIPPPAYTLQAPAYRLHPSMNNDPFLPRRSERDESRQPPLKPTSQAPYTLGSYAANLARDTVTPSIEVRDRPQENGGWMPRIGGGRVDRYRYYITEGSSLPPPPPSAPFTPSIQNASTQRESCRQPEHRGSSPKMYEESTVAHDKPPPPPPPPPSFDGRPMIPLSSQYNAQASISRASPPPPSFSKARELPTIAATSRPGGSISISSMLETESRRSNREPVAAPRMNGASPPSSYSSLTQQTASASSSMRSSNSNKFVHRSSPEVHHVSQESANRQFRAYSKGTPQRSYVSIKVDSPDSARPGPSSATATSKYSPILKADILPDQRQQSRNSSSGRYQTRPNSQSNSYNIVSFENNRALTELNVQRQILAKQKKEKKVREETLRQTNRDRISSFDYLSRQEQIERQVRLKQEAQPAAHENTRNERLSELNYLFLTQSSVFSEQSVNISQPEFESYTSRLINDVQSKSSTFKDSFFEDSLRRLREERQRLNQQRTSYSSSISRSRVLDKVDERQSHTYSHNVILATSASDETTNIDDTSRQSRIGEDAGQSYSNILSMIENKRLGYILSISQVVQGAQIQKRELSTDFTIKNKFSRIFADLDTNVSSIDMNSGTSTSFPPQSSKSSIESKRRPPFNSRDELIVFARARNESKIEKRASKKVKDDDAKEAEVTDGRIDGSTGTRGIKRKDVHHHHHDHEHDH